MTVKCENCLTIILRSSVNRALDLIPSTNLANFVKWWCRVRIIVDSTCEVFSRRFPAGLAVAASVPPHKHYQRIAGIRRFHYGETTNHW